MASYHCTVKAGGKGSAGKHSNYIEREGKYAPELTKGTSKLEDLECKASGNMPAWAKHEAGIFWRAADEHERANGATYREIEIALPRELNPGQRRALVEDFIAQKIGDRHAYTYAIHIPKAAIDKGDQPHCHFMYSERTLDSIDRDPEQYFKRANTKNPEKGGCKKSSGGKSHDERKADLLATRALWAEVQNKHLEKAGFDERVSHLSLKAQGIDRQPEQHLGPIDSKNIDAPALVESRSAERELELARTELSKIDITAALAQAKEAEQAQREAAAQAQADHQQTMAAAEQRVQYLQNLLTATLAAKEKEDDGIRAAAIDAITKSSAATDKSAAATGDTLAAASEIADRIGGNTAAAARGAERRVANRHNETSLNGVVRAIARQLEHTGRLLQRAVRVFPQISQSIAAAAQAVTQQIERKNAAKRLDDLITQRVEARKAKAQEMQAQAATAKAPEKKPEQGQQVAKAPAKVIPVAAQEKPPIAVLKPDTSAFDKTGLSRSDDVDLVQRAKALYSQAEPASYDRHMLDQEISKAMSEAVSRIRATEPKANHFGVEQTIKTEQNAAARSAGQQEPWKAGESNCTWYVLAAQRQRELDAHTRTQRPSGIFNRAAGKEYDDKTAGLTSQIDNIKRAAAKLEAELQARVAEQVSQAAQNGPQHAEAQERHAGLTLLHKALGEATRQIEANETQSGKAHGKGTSR